MDVPGAAPPVSRRFVRRVLDLVVAIPVSVVSLPVVAVSAVVSSLVYRANPFFVQERLGEGGRPFRFVKLRSLPTDAPPAADKYTIHDLPNSRWGRFLRLSHIDELPQSWHVLAGAMAVVGPRPEMPTLAATFDPDFVAERTTVRPGWTGLWQVSADAVALIGEHPEYDRHYVRHRTLRLDLWILLATIPVVLTAHPGFRLADVPRWTGAAVPPSACPDDQAAPVD